MTVVAATIICLCGYQVYLALEMRVVSFKITITSAKPSFVVCSTLSTSGQSSISYLFLDYEVSAFSGCSSLGNII